MSDLHHQLEPAAPAEVTAALGALGRTEDLRFSPDGRRLAIAGFAQRTVVLVDVAVDDGPVVALTGVTVARTDLGQPHGVDWLDTGTLVVGDRQGGLALLAVPPPVTGVRTVDVTTTPLATTPDLLRGPGSVAVTGRDVLVCGNWADALTCHRLADDDPSVVADEGVWLRRALDLPDGVAVSGDGRWLAVSNHNQQQVLVYDRAEAADPDERRPTAVLRGTRYPHGLRFTADGRHLLVADAGAPVVHVHRSAPDGWRLAGYPIGAIRVLADDQFHAGHRRPDEGGPKGIDVDPTGRVLAVTAEHRGLGLVDLAAALGDLPAPDPATLAGYEDEILDRVVTDRAERERARHDALAAEVREHDARALATRTEERAAAVEADAASVRAAADDAERRAEAAERRAVAAEEHLAAIRATRLWRAADRPRRLYARLRRSSR